MAAISQFLNKIGCDELRGRFLDNGVTDLDIVYHLTHDLIKDLVPDLKTRIKFCIGLEKFKKDQTEEVQKVIENAVVVFEEVPPLVPIQPVKAELPCENDLDFYEEPLVRPAPARYDTFKSPSFPTSSENKPDEEPSIDCGAPPSKKSKTSGLIDNFEVGSKSRRISWLTEEFDLRTMLESDIIGSSLLKIYENSQKPLDTRCQSYLCDLLIVYFLNRADNCRLANEDLGIIADQIVQVFKHECKETYYIPPVSKRESYDKRSWISKGKLVDKYRNKVSFIRNAFVKSRQFDDTSDFESASNSGGGRSQRKKHPTESSDPNATMGDDAKTSQAWLQFNVEPIDFVEFHWQRSRDARKSLVQNYTLKENIAMWPILKGPHGPRLIDTDFEYFFPNRLKNLSEKWDTFISVLLNSEKQKFTGNDLLMYQDWKENITNSNCRTYMEILLFNVVVAPKAKIRSVQGKTVKSTISEAQTSIIDTFRTLEEKDLKIAERRQAMETFGVEGYPFILTQGSSLEKIEHVYVIAEDACFLMPSVLRALDLCFKIYHVLGVKYPPQSIHIWLMIQWSVFNIHLPCDRKIPYVMSVLNKVEQRIKQMKGAGYMQGES